LPIDSDANIAYPHLTYINQNSFSYKQLPLPTYYPQLIPSATGIFAPLDGMIEIFKLSFEYRLDLISKENLASIQKPIMSNHDYPRKWRIKCPYDISKIECYYGLGWRILRAKTHPKTELICHSGHIAGVNTFVGFIPSQEMWIIILLNQSFGFPLWGGLSFWVQFLQ